LWGCLREGQMVEGRGVEYALHLFTGKIRQNFDFESFFRLQVSLTLLFWSSPDIGTRMSRVQQKMIFISAGKTSTSHCSNEPQSLRNKPNTSSVLTLHSLQHLASGNSHTKTQTMINLDLKLKRQKLVSPVFHQWKHYHDFTSYCACAFPTAVFAGGFCGQCNYRPSSSRRGASAVSNKQKMREKTEGAVNVKLLYPYEDTALQRTAERDRQELAIAPIRQNRLPGGILVPFAKGKLTLACCYAVLQVLTPELLFY